MNIVKSILALNGYLLCKKVEYGESQSMDPDSTSNVWYEVILSSKEKPSLMDKILLIKPGPSIEPGDLVRFPPRHVIEEEIGNEIFYSFSKSLVTFIIKKKDVKESLIERR